MDEERRMIGLAECLASELNVGRARLRSAGPGNLQHRSVEALSAIGRTLLAGECPVTAGPAQFSGQIDAAWSSLRETLTGWTPIALWELIDDENARAPKPGPAIALHIIAANTPLLAWTSVARALLVEAASIVRLPVGSPDVSMWTDLLVKQLESVDAELAELVKVVHWPSHEIGATRAFCRVSDAVLVYGSDATIAQVAQLTNNNTRFLGYGNRISFGIVLDGADLDKAARGTAMDMAIFDQQGCLSPQLIFVEGSTEDADRFSALLGTHLNSLRYLIPARRMSDAAAIREATAMVSFETGATIYADTNLQYTIVRHSSRPAFISQARGFVHVLETHCWRAGIVLLNEFGMGGKLQGASVAARKPECVTNLACELYKNGVCYVSPPGRLQMPPFAWRENGYCALSSLVDDLPQIRTGSE